MTRTGRLIALLALLALVACGSRTELFGAPTEGSDPGDLPPQPGVDAGTISTRDASPPTKPPPTRPPPIIGKDRVFAQTATTLYVVDVDSQAVETVADFSGCNGGVLDVAVDSSSRIFATTGVALYTIDPTTGKCTLVADGVYPNSLAFLPTGELVGYTSSSGDYLEIDAVTGAVTPRGSLGRGFLSSGDVVATNSGVFVSVIGAECNQEDCLVEVDPGTGQVTKNWGPIGRSSVYGLASVGRQLYGFDAAGDLIAITFAGDKLATKVFPLPGNLPFYGAGSP